MCRALVTAVGLIWPLLNELCETRHQFDRPSVIDSQLTERTFGLAPTPWEEALPATVTALAR